jgi:hypothetical protein
VNVSKIMHSNCVQWLRLQFESCKFTNFYCCSNVGARISFCSCDILVSDEFALIAGKQDKG